MVDRLLTISAYAERMAFRWMEAARYGDTNGYRPMAPRYVALARLGHQTPSIKNMPYDEFTVEQLAGELLPIHRDQIIATGFNRNHRTAAKAASFRKNIA